MSPLGGGAALLEVRDLTLRRRGFVLGPLNLRLQAGELLILTGPAGAGKSTLLRLLALRERPDEGRLLHRQLPVPARNAVDIAAWRRRLGIVDQQGLLLPERSLREQMALLAGARGRRRAEARRDGMRVLTDLGLHALADRPCGQLSTGQQRWCQLALALCGSPELLLLDEPLAQLPAATRRELFEQIRRCCGRGAAALLCSHDEDLIEQGSARVLRLAAGRLAEERRAARRTPGLRGSGG
jgi:ABC-type multidrug transport system ATPase subunit